MTELARLAVLESGEPAVRVLAAVGNLNRTDQLAVTAVLVHAEPDAAVVRPGGRRGAPRRQPRPG